MDVTVPNIRNAHDPETRNIINRSIDVTNELGKRMEDLVAKGQLTPAQYATLIQTVNGLISKGNVTFDDIDINQGKLLPKHASEELLSMMTGNTPINAVPTDGSLTTVKYANKSVTREKLSGTFASGKRLFNDDNLNAITDEGVYFKFAGANPTGLPSELVGLECFVEVRSWYATSTVNYTIQRITTEAILNKVFVRTVKDGQVPGDFKVFDISEDDYKLTKETLPSTDLNSFSETGYHLGLSTNSYQNLPTEMEGLSFLLRVESFAAHQGFLIQTIYQTSGQIQNSYKRFVQVVPNGENTVGAWFKDYSLLGSSGGGGGGEAYDQSLNTTDDVKFASIEVGGDIPKGTLSSPPAGLLKGDVWADTTDSAAHPVLRVKV